MGMGGMGMGRGMGGGMGMGRGMGDDDDDDTAEEEREETLDLLTELIRDIVEPGTWAPDSDVGDVKEWQDKLLIRHIRRAQRKVRRLFQKLRSIKDLQVAVEARFITMTNNFLEEIGVDLDVVLNSGNAGLDTAVVPGALPVAGMPPVSRDPMTGAIYVHPRQFTQLGFSPNPAAFGQGLGQSVTLNQPYGNVGLVPSGGPSNYFSRHSTPIPLINNSMLLARPQSTGIPGSLAGESTPAFQMFGSFLDNLQVDFLLRATQLDVRSSIVDAPRVAIYNGREARIRVGTNLNYVAQPGQLPVGGTGVGGQAAGGRPPSISSAFSGREFRVTPTVSGDRKYVTLQLTPTWSSVEFEDFLDATGPLQLPRTTTTEMSTTVIVPDRGWLLLGGLRQAGETEVEAAVPIVSKIPILKRAFTNRSVVKDERVVLLLIRPTVIIQQEEEGEAFPDLISADRAGG